MNDNPRWQILQGDALQLLPNFVPGTFDAIITDPPYASGGRTQAEKNKSPAKKYSSMGDHAPPPFDGDSKDQRSWTRWAAEWLSDARKLCKPGAPVCMFIDWRQLPAASDALQWAGWIWRGTAVWDKGNSRPQKGRFRQQAEYIVWGSNGDMPINRPVPCLPGVFKYGNPQNRIHLTEKPLQLMRDIVKITEPGGHILDPFAGSGTTVLAAVLGGYTATGIEVTDEYARLPESGSKRNWRRVRELWALFGKKSGWIGRGSVSCRQSHKMEVREMRVAMTFDRQKVEQQGYTLADVRQTIQKNFEVYSLHCIQDGATLSCANHGGEDDFANLWAVIMALLRTAWFPALVSSCVWQDDNGIQEDLLAQAEKLQGRRVT